MAVKTFAVCGSVLFSLLLVGCAAEPSSNETPGAKKPEATLSETRAQKEVSPASEATGSLVAMDSATTGRVEVETFEIKGDFDGDPRMARVTLKDFSSPHSTVSIGAYFTAGTRPQCFDLGSRIDGGHAAPDGDGNLVSELPLIDVGAVDCTAERKIAQVVVYLDPAGQEDASELESGCINVVVAAADLDWVE
ncbi:hypothetical protein U746_0340 [Mycolicibacterium mucogenicum 261Sha1.1M5]|nr:hypothetical protein U746_0340 [Mycolicibacterium mucogenicum 261Sha1.1M5]